MKISLFISLNQPLRHRNATKHPNKAFQFSTFQYLLVLYFCPLVKCTVLCKSTESPLFLFILCQENGRQVKQCSERCTNIRRNKLYKAKAGILLCSLSRLSHAASIILRCRHWGGQSMTDTLHCMFFYPGFHSNVFYGMQKKIGCSQSVNQNQQLPDSIGQQSKI